MNRLESLFYSLDEAYRVYKADIIEKEAKTEELFNEKDVNGAPNYHHNDVWKKEHFTRYVENGELLEEKIETLEKANQQNRKQTNPWKEIFITMVIFLALWTHNENKPTKDPPPNSDPLMSVNTMASYASNMWKDIESKNKEKTLPPETDKEEVLRQNIVDTRHIVHEWMTSVNLAYAAKAIRPNLFMFPPVIGHKCEYRGEMDGNKCKAEPVKDSPPETSYELKNLNEFVDKRINTPGGEKNDPNVTALPAKPPWGYMSQVAMWRYIFTIKEHLYMTPRKVAGEKTNLAAVGTSTKFVNDEAKIVPKSEDTVKELVPHLISKTEKLFKNTKTDKTVKEDAPKETTTETGAKKSEKETVSDLENSMAEHESNTNTVKDLDKLDSAEAEKTPKTQEIPKARPRARPPEQDPAPPPKRSRPTPTNTQEDDDIKEVVPVKTGPREHIPTPAPVKMYHAPSLIIKQVALPPPQLSHIATPVQQTQQLQQINDSLQYAGDESYDDYGQYGGESGIMDIGMEGQDASKGLIISNFDQSSEEATSENLEKAIDGFIGKDCGPTVKDSYNDAENRIEAKHFTLHGGYTYEEKNSTDINALNDYDKKLEFKTEKGNSAPTKQYIKQLRNITHAKLITKVAQAHQSVYMKHLLSLTVFTNHDHIQRLIVKYARNNGMQVLPCQLSPSLPSLSSPKLLFLCGRGYAHTQHNCKKIENALTELADENRNQMFDKYKKELVALKETETNNLERKLGEINNTISHPRLNCGKCEVTWANESQNICAKCDMNFVTHKEFTLHVKSSHPNAVHTCKKCGRNFADNQQAALDKSCKK